MQCHSRILRYMTAILAHVFSPATRTQCPNMGIKIQDYDSNATSSYIEPGPPRALLQFLAAQTFFRKVSCNIILLPAVQMQISQPAIHIQTLADFRAAGHQMRPYRVLQCVFLRQCQATNNIFHRMTVWHMFFRRVQLDITLSRCNIEFYGTLASTGIWTGIGSGC
jgi:hypothetical protein